MTSLEQMLLALAYLDPEYSRFITVLPPDLAREESPLPDELLEDVFALLSDERPDLSDWIIERQSIQFDKMAIDPLMATGVLAAVLFLLRSHIRIKDGQLFFEHKPIESDLLKKVLDSLSAFLIK